jgi:hypothetical protein
LEDFKQQKLPAARVIFTGGSHGLMAKNGKILQKDLLFIGGFEDGLTRFSKKGQLSVTLTKNNVNFGKLGKYLGDMLSANGMSSVTLFDQELVQQGTIICKDCLWGFMDTLGRIPIPPQYDFARKFKNEVAVVQLENDWGLINKDGQTILKCAYNDVEYLENSDSLMIQVLVKKEKIGLIDNTGKVIIPAIYTDLGEVREGTNVNRILAFSEGKGLIRNPKYQYSFITKNNKLSKGFFQDALPYQNGVAIIKKEGHWGLLTQQGVEIVPPKYDKIEPFENGYARIKIKNFKGATDLEGNFIVEPNYEYITYWGNGIFRVENGDKLGYFNIEGDWIWAME